MPKYQPEIAFYTYKLAGGGAERMIVNLMQNFAQKGLKIDLVLNNVSGPYLPLVPPEVRIIDLNAKSVFRNGIFKLANYLKTEKPLVMLATFHPCSEVALLAKLWSSSPTKIIVREENTLSINSRMAKNKGRYSPFFAKMLYPKVADEIIAISKGVAEDLIRVTGISKSKISVIYNPAFTPSVREKAQEPLDHPWFQKGEPPVILGVGRLEIQKDFPTLIKAFSILRKQQSCRLVILGEGEERNNIKHLIMELGLENDVALLGFQENPFKYMAKASVFVLSSAWEGFGNVIVEALAVGTPVVSTNCPSGPAEILDNNKYGLLVPVGDSKAMSEAIACVLSDNSPLTNVDHSSWLHQFALESIAQKYFDVIQNHMN